MNMELPQETEVKKSGVQDVKIENDHYVVSIVWKDGKENTHNFPMAGFSVIDVNTKKSIGFISGNEAIEILKKYSPDYLSEEFSWVDFVRE